MKSIYCVLTILIVFGLGCDDYAPKYEEPTIDEKKMAEMVANVHIIEAYAQNVKATERDSVKAVLYNELFEMYAIDTAVFYENQRLYYENPTAVENLYEDVLQILEDKGQEIESKKLNAPKNKN
jgi:hypothetical protein